MRDIVVFNKDNLSTFTNSYKLSMNRGIQHLLLSTSGVVRYYQAFVKNTQWLPLGECCLHEGSSSVSTKKSSWLSTLKD